MLKILVVEDDMYLNTLMCKTLKSNHYDVISAEDGDIAYDYFLNEHIDLMITDILMPHTDGITLTKRVRQINANIPIIMLTALHTLSDKEKGFTSGADDYLVKPIDMKELLLHVQALLRRYQLTSSHQFKHKHIFLDYDKQTCTIKEQPIDLTTKEFKLLFLLSTSHDRIFTREQLMNEIWGYDSESYERTVDTHIKRLREKLQTNDIDIETVRGLGYKVVLK